MTGQRIEQAAKTWKYIIIVCIAYLSLIALFASETYVTGMFERERQMIYSVMGTGPAGHAEARATRWYREAFLDSGIVESSLRIVAAGAESAGNEGAPSVVAKPLRYIESRLRTMWLLLYQLQLRVSVTIMWWPYVVLIFLPTLIDALTQRRIASTNFSTPSPTMHMMAKSLLWLFLIGSIAVLFAPIPMPPILTPIMAFFGACAMWISMTMFAKSA